MADATLTERAIEGLPTIGIDDLAEGDVLLFSDGGTFQQLLWVVDDPWMHSGLVIRRGGELCTAEAGTGPEIFHRPVEKSLATYQHLAVARPTGLAPSCVAAAVHWAADHLGAEQHYAWDDFILAGLLLTTRRALPPRMLGKLGEVLEEMAELANDDPKATVQSMTCSAFVHQAFNQGNGCRLAVSFTDPTTGAKPANPGLAPAAVGDEDDRPPSLEVFLTMPEDAQAAVLADWSLLDLVDAGGPDPGPDGWGVPPIPGMGDPGLAAPGLETRAMHGSRVSARQLASALRTVAELTARYIASDPVIDGSPVEGRWVSPSDLWRCDEFGYRAVLRAD
ncbi:MAG: hypothetical protein AAF547_04905 [Actinomycetota bacterium]